MVTRRTPAWTSRRFLERELNALSQEIVHLSDVDQLADLLLERLGRTLRLSWAAITLEDEGSSDRRYCWGIPPNDYLTVPRFEPQFGDSPQLFFVDTELNGLAVQLIANGVRIGTVMLGAKQEGAEFLSTDIKLLRFLTPLAASALRNGLLVRRLEQQVKALADREQELRALGLRLMNVAEEERRRLALDLHDDPLQRAILLSREMRENPAAEQLDVWIRQVEEIAISLRATCQHVRPPALDDLGLVAALERLINDYRARSEAELDLLVEDDHRETLASLDPALRVAIYRVAQEAIANCHKHARATRIIVRLTLLEKRIVLQVLDNGRGFEERDLSVPGFSLGILGMRERLRPWSGVLRVERDVNGGTVLTAEIAVDGPMEETSNVE